jgi:hypothetical protein
MNLDDINREMRKFQEKVLDAKTNFFEPSPARPSTVKTLPNEERYTEPRQSVFIPSPPAKGFLARTEDDEVTQVVIEEGYAITVEGGVVTDGFTTPYSVSFDGINIPGDGAPVYREPEEGISASALASSPARFRKVHHKEGSKLRVTGTDSQVLIDLKARNHLHENAEIDGPSYEIYDDSVGDTLLFRRLVQSYDSPLRLDQSGNFVEFDLKASNFDTDGAKIYVLDETGEGGTNAEMKFKKLAAKEDSPLIIEEKDTKIEFSGPDLNVDEKHVSMFDAVIKEGFVTEFSIPGFSYTDLCVEVWHTIISFDNSSGIPQIRTQVIDSEPYRRYWIYKGVVLNDSPGAEFEPEVLKIYVTLPNYTAPPDPEPE